MYEVDYSFTILQSDAWAPGILAGGRLPGGDLDLLYNEELFELLKREKNTTEIVGEKLIRDLDLIHTKGVTIIYSVLKPESKTLRYLWENLFTDTKFVTKVGEIDLGIEDYHAPSQEQLSAITSDAINKLKANEDVLVHCHGGKGRTGTILAAIYMKANNISDANIAQNYVRENYNIQSIETDEQFASLELFGKNLHIDHL